MPHFLHAPEALLGRNDSKNASTTCKGITSTGRACRRALASPKSSPSSRRSSSAGARVDGLTLIVSEEDSYCWQHRDQAQQDVADAEVNTKKHGNAAGRAAREGNGLPTLQERSSIDTLVQKLGIVAQDSGAEQKPRSKHSNNPRPPRKTQTSDFAPQAQPNPSSPHHNKCRPALSSARRSKPRKKGFWAGLCCMTSEDDDYVEIVRHRKRTSQAQSPQMAIVTTPSNPIKVQSPIQPRPPSNQNSSNPLSLIPENLSPQTTSVLLAELVKPISPYDEDGYIYIFWLTPSSFETPDLSVARSLLTTPESRPHQARRISNMMTEYSYKEEDRSAGLATGSAEKTIMLKIGRANNITRRMNEWQRQCGYALNLVRWYPYVPSSASPQPSSQQQQGRRESEGVHTCPHIHRVERLIHLELTSKQVKRHCGACGREHREWFEVSANRESVQAVDEVVKRWIKWAGSRTDGS